ncbi:hypothetical protein IFT54_05460 [Sphingomonas sp. CFBP 13714]|uniref:hypothetical protein n=1 Tax=Sphingomonas sp. CFBP 13714 TaxID=2775308 RepID=UPI00178180DB|nr:hypothetical protein [Sphingomonas sp. CFBP 13714]MBD8699262.1 hypothetical protein [Sphingomonas sp. CFBP 13714]
MYSDAERAAFAALLVRARANEIITEDEVQGVLPPDLFARFVALTITRENEVIDKYDDEVWANWRSDPYEVEYYKNQMKMSKKSFRAAPKELEKLMAKNGAESLFNRQLGILVNQKSIMWGMYKKLSDDGKLWTKQGSAEAGWPPELVTEPPMKVVLPGMELPTAYALRRLLAKELGEE